MIKSLNNFLVIVINNFCYPYFFFFSINLLFRLRLVGGGVTSPDNLLPSGESFIRNYLIGKRWLDRWQIPYLDTYWMPDNFGHDSQLPIVLNAMGAQGINFPLHLNEHLRD